LAVIDSVTVYAPGSSGNAVPSATIGSNTGMVAPVGIGLDASDNIYVTSVGSTVGGFDSVAIYPYGSYANEPPTAVIRGEGSPNDNTLLSSPTGVAVDPSGNIFVANGMGGFDGLGSITEYAPVGNRTGNLNIAPKAMIAGDVTGDNTELNAPAGVAFDSLGNIYVANADGGPDGVGSVSRIRQEFRV